MPKYKEELPLPGISVSLGLAGVMRTRIGSWRATNVLWHNRQQLKACEVTGPFRAPQTPALLPQEPANTQLSPHDPS